MKLIQKYERKNIRRKKWQSFKQNSARFLAKVFLSAEDVSFLGATRIVIICRTKVIKFPRFWSLEVFLRGWLCNITEKDNWHILNKFCMNELSNGHPLRSAFAPVNKNYLWGFFVVMKRASPVPHEDIQSCISLWKSNSDWDLIKSYCSDPNMNNFGMIDGSIVVIDYAQ